MSVIISIQYDWTGHQISTRIARSIAITATFVGSSSLFTIISLVTRAGLHETASPQPPLKPTSIQPFRHQPFTAFCKNTGHGASGRNFFCATTKNWPIGKIEYVATVDLINSYLIDRFNRISLEFAVYLVNSLNINYLCSQTVAIAIWAKYQPYGQTSAM